MSGTAELAVVERPEQASALLDPVRRSLLERLKEPGSASTLARQMALPRQRVNYHLRELEKEGLVELVEERKRGNCVERLLRATARSYLISPEALGSLGGDVEGIKDRFSAGYLIALAARLIRELAALRTRAEAAHKKLATFSLQADIRFRSAAERNQFAEELASAVARLTTRYHDTSAEEGRLFRLVVGAYPALTRPEGAGEAEEKER